MRIENFEFLILNRNQNDLILVFFNLHKISSFLRRINKKQNEKNRNFNSIYCRNHDFSV